LPPTILSSGVTELITAEMTAVSVLRQSAPFRRRGPADRFS